VDWSGVEVEETVVVVVEVEGTGEGGWKDGGRRTQRSPVVA